MIYVNVAIVVISAVLAIISRKHYSKYKDKKGLKAGLVAVGLAIGESVWNYLKDTLPLDGIRLKLAGLLRKNQVVSPKRLELITDKFIINCLGICFGIIFASNLVELGSNLHSIFLRDEKNIIERESYEGDAKKEEITYEIAGEKQTMVLNVSPARLSEEEFFKKADVLAEDVELEYLHKGEKISSDIELPLSDKEGVFVISWESEHPHIISNRGRIKAENIEEPKTANLKMIVSYYDYSVEYKFQVTVGAKNKSEEELIADNLEQALYNLEQENPEETKIIIPEKVDGIQVELSSQQGRGGGFLLLGLILGVGSIFVFVSRIKEAGQKRDRRLMGDYPFFVDSLWIYIEAGMNIKRAIKQYITGIGDKDSILVDELRYTINQIENGEAEYSAYEELGARLNLSVYMNLMRHISQNLKMGTKDLRALMETEVTMALEAKKETAKKLGEEASTKLVFPMIVLLLVVMIMIMTPAFMGF